MLSDNAVVSQNHGRSESVEVHRFLCGAVRSRGGVCVFLLGAFGRVRSRPLDLLPYQSLGIANSSLIIA